MILITGASAGIGLACARKFAERGRDLVLVARRVDRLRQVAAALIREHGVEVHVDRLDVADRADVDRFAREHADWLARLEVLVNNAGMARGLATLQEGSADDWDVMIDTNIKGLLYVTRAVIPGFVQRGSGHVVNLGSVAGYWTYPRGNVYSATKFAVRGLTESLRLDLHGTGVRVTEIAPGMVETEFSEVRFRGDRDKAKAVYQGFSPLTPEDIADAVEWCVSRPARVNVQNLVIYPTDQASPSLVNRQG